MQSDPTSQPNPSSESDQSSDRQLFEELINIPRWLNEDREQPYPERLHRDREIAREFRENPEGTLAELRYWWHRVPG